jgi:hypothetical protein
MKKIYSLLCYLTVISFGTVIAQQPSFGIRGGISISDWHGNAVNSLSNLVTFSNGMVSTRSTTGFHAGGYMNIPATETFSVEPGIYFSQKGYMMKGDVDINALKFFAPGASINVQSSYIDVPVILKANLTSGLQLYAGPQVSYLLHNNLHVAAGVLGFSLFKRDMDVTSSFKKWDVGVTGGLAYQFSNGFNIQAGYEHGLSKLDANSNFRSYNRVIKVGVGYTF